VTTSNLKPFKKGQSGNPAGKPKGAISVIARLKKKFRENPEEFEEFLDRYSKNPNNERHITEMLDGKPYTKGELVVDFPTSLIEAIKHGTTHQTGDTGISEEDSE
jgi:hypothetical protein